VSGVGKLKLFSFSVIGSLLWGYGVFGVGKWVITLVETSLKGFGIWRGVENNVFLNN
jgi:hypothetical protein